MTTRVLESLSFDNSYARLPEVCYAKLNPTPFAVPPYLVSFNPAAAELIDLDSAQAKRPEFAGVFGGSLLVPGWSRWPCSTPAINLESMSPSWEMGGRSSSEKYGTNGAKSGICI